MHLEHEICDLSRRLFRQRPNTPRTVPKCVDVSENEYHLHFRLHILAGHGIVCTCDVTFPTIYHAYRHVLPQKRGKGGKLRTTVHPHPKMPLDHGPSLAILASVFRYSFPDMLLPLQRNHRYGFTYRSAYHLATESLLAT